MSEVKPTGDPHIFEVASSAAPNIFYRINVKANDGYGSCQCQDFNRRKKPVIDRKQAKGTTETACKHILAALRFFLNSILS